MSIATSASRQRPTTVETRNRIGHQWVSTETVMAVDDPSNDEIIAEVPKCSTDNVQAAIGAAAHALDGWQRLTANDRGRRLDAFARLVDADSERLAALVSREGGKPISEARAEVSYGQSFLAWSAEEATRIYGDVVPAWHPDKRVMVTRQAVGVTAAITPWNFPMAMITRKLGPAMAAGCTQVIKPASQTPLTAIALAEIAMQADIPDGVINVVTGPGPLVAQAMLADPRVRKLSFTGSTEVGQELIRLSARHVTRLSLELGGHAPTIVFDDADLDAAVAGVMRAKFRNSGQSCIAANRIYLHARIHDEFLARFSRAVCELKLGPTDSDDSEVGPLIDTAAVARVQGQVDDAVARGAEVVCGGQSADLGTGFSARYYTPTVLAGVTDDMQVFQEETFGPVAAIRSFDDSDDVVAWANNSPFGLAAYVFSRDLGRVMRTTEALQYGVIGVNDGAPSSAQVPFGGLKASGYGREGGKYVMDDYLDIKYVSLGLN
jgi:succinate-semialdehyde dehydrogenase / glutarate-semialdehyde dehydrogenase